MAPEPQKQPAMELPLSLVTLIDLGRLERELATLDEFSLQSNIRESGMMPKLPRVSHTLEEMADQNHVNLLVDEERQKLIAYIKQIREKAPIVHISFASDPSAGFLSKVITWFRSEVHPQILLQIGLQPNIAAGCVLRTTNKYFDFSLRKYFADKRQMLISELTVGDAQSVGK